MVAGATATFRTVAKKIDNLQRATDGRALRKVTERVGSRSKVVAAKVVDPDSLSHWGRGPRRGGFKVKARYKMLSDHEVAIQPTVPPLAALLEEGSYKAGGVWKAPRRRGGPRRKKGSIGTYTRASVPARHAWSKAPEAVRAKAPEFVDEEVLRILRGIF